MSTLSCEAYVCDPRPNYPLFITAKRYWIPDDTSEDPEALTLVFAHGTGFHKEQWEPTIEELYDSVRREGKPRMIREAWSIDAPNGGDAAVLNEETLLQDYSVFDWQEYARAVHIFLTGLGTGVDVDFSDRKLVGIGHSMGAIAMILAGTYVPKLKFTSVILVDPVLYPHPPLRGVRDISGPLLAATNARRDIWPSRAEALAACQARSSFKAWDARVLQIFIEHGLRDLPTTYYPDKSGVTLKYSKAQEVASYKDEQGKRRAYNYLPTLCAKIPVHFIYGAVDDFLPRIVQDYTLNIGTKGRYASARRVEGSGHMVPQMQPKGLADAIREVLTEEPAPHAATRASSRL
ncbi:alpha/beta-hydrolase [Sparassis crispa]|uniref:Alpha/beta-hydrolase n=1 Tax=Sparassis crispa TaxID=139825 RepID=A0A401GSE4_9APHY|nr:alpha/beta-hydrolase [Sparassis crispa]GBE85089.1 alpha/beta-hydrolase [Sparassis crispa]